MAFSPPSKLPVPSPTEAIFCWDVICVFLIVNCDCNPDDLTRPLLDPFWPFWLFWSSTWWLFCYCPYMLTWPTFRDLIFGKNPLLWCWIMLLLLRYIFCLLLKVWLIFPALWCAVLFCCWLFWLWFWIVFGFTSRVPSPVTLCWFWPCFASMNFWSFWCGGVLTALFYWGLPTRFSPYDFFW